MFITPYPANKCCILFISAAYIFKWTPENFKRGSKHYELKSDCSMEQQSDLGPSCLQLRHQSIQADESANGNCCEWRDKDYGKGYI